MVYLNQGKYTEAWKSCDKALNLFEQIKDFRGQADTNYKMGLIYLDQKSYKESLNRHELAMEYLEKAGLTKTSLGKIIKTSLKSVKNKMKS